MCSAHRLSGLGLSNNSARVPARPLPPSAARRHRRHPVPYHRPTQAFLSGTYSSSTVPGQANSLALISVLCRTGSSCPFLSTEIQSPLQTLTRTSGHFSPSAANLPGCCLFFPLFLQTRQNYSGFSQNTRLTSEAVIQAPVTSRLTHTHTHIRAPFDSAMDLRCRLPAAASAGPLLHTLL